MMKRLLRASFFAVLCAIVSLGLACGDIDDGNSDDTVQTIEQAQTHVDPDTGCRYRCQPCPPNQYCTQVCEPVGQCKRQCTVIELCAEGYEWDDKSCSCKPAGEQCGDVTCGAGTVCCNSSCGICTEPGGYCTQQVCY